MSIQENSHWLLSRLNAIAKLAMDELHVAIGKQQTTHSEAASVVAGDFNHFNQKKVLPR